jgi:hypothetical protein
MHDHYLSLQEFTRMDENSPIPKSDFCVAGAPNRVKRTHARRKRNSPDEGYILRILSEARDPLFPSEVTERVNYELTCGAPYTMTEVAMRLMTMNRAVNQLPDGRWTLKHRGAEMWQ